jgi:hypothetical protein
MSTKIDRANAATPSVPTQPTEPVKAAEAPRAPGKADVEPAVVQDVIERGASMLDAGRALFGIASKTAAQAIEGAAKEGAARITKTVAELQADATHAVKQAVTQSAKPLASDGAIKLVSDLLTKGVEQTVKDEFKAIRPAIADAARIADQIGRASDVVEQRLRGVPDEVRGRAAELLLEIQNNTAPRVTAEDLKRPLTDPRRVVAEMAQVGQELAQPVLDKGVVGSLVEVGLAAADVVATYGDGVRDAAQVVEGLISGRKLAESLGFEGVRPFALINYPLVKLLDSVQSVVGGAEKITSQAEQIRELSVALTPGSLKERIHALEPGQTLVTSLGGEIKLHEVIGGSGSAKLEAKIACEAGTPPVYTVEIGNERLGSMGLGISGMGEGVSVDGFGSKGEKLTYKVEGRENLDKLLEALYTRGLGVAINPGSLSGVLKEDMQIESSKRGGGKFEASLGVASAGTQADITHSTSYFYDKKTGELSAISDKFVLNRERALGLKMPGISIKLPDVPGQQGEALRSALTAQLKDMTPLTREVGKHIPDALVNRLLELNGNRTDISLKAVGQAELTIKRGAKVDNILQASELTVAANVQLELGNTNVEAKAETTIKNPALLFKAFEGKLDPAQLVAGLRSGEVTNAQLEAQVKASGFKLEDVLVVKLTVTEKTMNSVGVDALGLNAEHGVQTAKSLYEAKLNNEGRFESTVSNQDSRSSRALHELGHSILRG